MTRIALTLALAAYNNLANAWPPFNRAAYVPANLLLTAAVALVAFGPLGLTFEEVVGELAALDALLGAALGALLTAPLFIASRWPRWRARIADQRSAHLSGGRLVYRCLVGVPIGTALTEEWAFRGVTFAAWAQTESTFAAALISSAAFGLWHIAPARHALLANRPQSTRAALVRHVSLTVVVTTLAGLGLVALRIADAGLLLPLAVHATVNSLATLAAVRAGRKIES
ncbi:MAG: lysostaphin resistance A-like protein [Actinomycetota bacterium]